MPNNIYLGTKEYAGIILVIVGNKRIIDIKLINLIAHKLIAHVASYCMALVLSILAT